MDNSCTLILQNWVFGDSIFNGYFQTLQSLSVYFVHCPTFHRIFSKSGIIRSKSCPKNELNRQFLERVQMTNKYMKYSTSLVIKEM
jgi:hypothetical protein